MFDNPIHQIKEKSSNFSQVTATEYPPLFCVPGTNGISYSLYHLTVHLSEKGYSVYGFNAPGIEIKTTPLETVEDYASLYVKALKTFFKADSYYLGGYCFGSLVIFEMARLLLEAGHQVRLILIDPATPRITVNPAKQWLKNVLSSKIQISEILPNLLQEPNFRCDNWDCDPTIPSHYYEIRDKAKMASLNYRPKPLNVDALFISRFDNMLNSGKWYYLTSGCLTEQAIACNHLDMLNEPYVKTVAEWIDEYLQDLW